MACAVALPWATIRAICKTANAPTLATMTAPAAPRPIRPIVAAAEGPSGGGSGSAPCPDGPDTGMAQHYIPHVPHWTGTQGC